MNINLFRFLMVAFSFFLVSGCSFAQKTNKKTNKKETIEGFFESKKGVMNTISCYCYNVGYLKTTDEKKIIVCFDRMAYQDTPECSKISVTGYFEEHKVQEGTGSPCPGGVQNIFYVDNFECKD